MILLEPSSEHNKKNQYFASRLIEQKVKTAFENEAKFILFLQEE